MMASTIWSGWGDGVLQAPVSAPAPEPPLTLSLWLEPQLFPFASLSICQLLTGNILKIWMLKRVKPLPHR